MALGLIGKKIGMTRVFDANGISIPVTVVHINEIKVIQLKKKTGKDKYSAVQLGTSEQKESRLSKPELGHLKKWGATPLSYLREVRLGSDEEVENLRGKIIDTSIFEVGAYVDVIGVTKGKGFQGVVKRYKFAGQPATHGSMMHRRTGAIGCRSTPGLVWKNQKMPGHQGCYNRTIQNLQIIQNRVKEGVLLIKGAIPGHTNCNVYVRPAIKK